MARLSLRAKILPTGTEVDLDNVAKNISSSLKDGITLSKYAKEPLAFGIFYRALVGRLAGQTGPAIALGGCQKRLRRIDLDRM